MTEIKSCQKGQRMIDIYSIVEFFFDLEFINITIVQIT